MDIQDEAIFPYLTRAYDRGILVPFVGAGISWPNCVLWSGFVENLEKEAGIKAAANDAQEKSVLASQLIQRAARAVRKLRYRQAMSGANFPTAGMGAATAFATSVKKALDGSHGGKGALPPTAKSLAEIWWPLVITTNYDDWFSTAWSLKFIRDQRRRLIERMEVCGRSPSDCERILNSLRAPDNSLLWAIQGFIGGFHPDSKEVDFDRSRGKAEELAQQLVIGHEEYRREAYRSPGFRRAFCEVFRSRSFFFIGSGLSEGYFENLFDEALELHGALPHLHFALVKRGSVNCDFLRDRFQIMAIEYEDHGEVPVFLGKFRERLWNRSRADRWAASVGPEDAAASRTSSVQVVRSVLPKPVEGECLLISAGWDGRMILGEAGELVLKTHFSDINLDRATLLPNKPKVWRFDEHPAFAVAARTSVGEGRDARDARTVFNAIGSALDAAREAGFKSVHTMLLAAGKGRVFAPYVSLIQMVQGYADWSRRNSVALPLTIHVVDPGATHLLASGRLNLSDLISTTELRFWVEVWRSASDISRHLEFRPPETLLREIVKKYDLPEHGWQAAVIPSPIHLAKKIDAFEIMQESGPDAWTLTTAGIMPGSTLRIMPAAIDS